MKQILMMLFLSNFLECSSQTYTKEQKPDWVNTIKYTNFIFEGKKIGTS